MKKLLLFAGLLFLPVFLHTTHGAADTVIIIAPPTHSWQTGSGWSDCSNYCGGGLQTRIVRCTDSHGHIVPNEECDAVGGKPAACQACNDIPCEKIISDPVKLTPAGSDSQRQLGRSVSIFGNNAIVGGIGNSAYILSYDGSSWSEKTELVFSAPSYQGNFYSRVSISGNVAIVGNYYEQAAYIFTKNGEGWAQTARLTPNDPDNDDSFGYAVSISGDTAVVGAYADDGKGINSGAAYVFQNNGGIWTQTAKMTAVDTGGYDFFGNSVAISETTMVVGAVGDNQGAGSAYIFSYDGTAWIQEGKLSRPAGAAFDRFGGSVSISGDTAIVGAHESLEQERGSACIFSYDGGSWVLDAHLTSPYSLPYENFGRSVAISGDTAIVGAVGDEGNGNSSASVYTFKRNGNSWEFEAILGFTDRHFPDEFGLSIAVSDSNAIVGAPGEEAAYIYSTIYEPPILYGDVNGDFAIDLEDLVISLQTLNNIPPAQLTSDGDINNDNKIGLKEALYISEVVAGERAAEFKRHPFPAQDGIKTCPTDEEICLAMGCPQGARWSIGPWEPCSAPCDGGTQTREEARCVDSTDAVVGDIYCPWPKPSSFRSCNTDSCDAELLFTLEGSLSATTLSSVSIDGNTAIVGDTNADIGEDNSGVADIFSFDGLDWNHSDQILPTDSHRYHFFGQSVSISGNNAIVGTYMDSTNGERSGAAYIFSHDGTSWSQTAKLLPSDGAEHDQFGGSVAIDGQTAVVGARIKGSSSGAAYIFQLYGNSWVETAKLVLSDAYAYDFFGTSVSIHENRVIVSAPGKNYNRGAAYIYAFNGTSWVQSAKLTADDATRDANFGNSVSIAKDIAIVGQISDDSAYIFSFDGSFWNQTVKLTPDGGELGDRFGESVAISSDNGIAAVVGARYADGDESSRSGSAYVFTLDGVSWSQSKIKSPENISSGFFGGPVAISGNRILIGADGTGSAHIYQYDDSQVMRPLSVTLSGTGSGTVASTPTGIDCGADGYHNFPAGTVVTLSAISSDGSSFAGWTGDCAGTEECTVTLDSARAVGAIFSED